MTARRTPRERAREELTAQIKEAALRQLAASGASRLSLRAVSRELGMVSSALYRYFPSRDHLLTALIADAYADLADAIGAADRGVPSASYRQRWVTACHALRSWALAHPHRFGLIYGSPVPDYRAPQDTVAPAVRVMTALSGIVDEAAVAGALADGPSGPLSGELAGQLQRVGRTLGEAIPAPALATLAAGLGQVVGLVNLELAGHFVGGFEPADALFAHAVARLADSLGLPG